MQIEALKVFADLAESKSFTKTAHINGVTQSAVSQQIGAMERQFHSLLIERSKKQFRLTREGAVLYDFSKQIVETYDALQGKLQEIKAVVSGSIRLATVYSIGLHILPPYLQRFLRAHPTVNVHVAYRHAREVYEDVLSNVSDLGMVAFPWKDPHLEQVPFRKEPMVLICAPDHPLAKRKSLKLAALAREKLIMFEAGIPTRGATDRALRDQGITPHPVMEFDNVETLKRAVEIGAGVAIAPQTSVAQEVADGTLSQVKLEDCDLDRPLVIVHKKNKVLSPAIKQFMTMLKKES
jgi:LysR family transcriptional regulator, transcriptional activator of the cysJI operon